MAIVVKGLRSNSAKIKGIVHDMGLKAMKANMQDLNRVASEAAPLDEGVLEMSGTNSATSTGTRIVGEVGFEAYNEDFNYAIWTHEETYNLGERSAKKSGGSGLSGKSYEVGKGYLIRPFEGEAKTYRGIIEKEIKDGLKNA
ncbi:hypothetical protein [Priestia megaterium]|uniref:hypothetical protein n=1 Tax=Priestia megaterium TaxID=1404 RepID=UPI002861EDC4|nr:hypothetical protein [Priestia megaterium]MDR7207597.1 hypothetical protein [Priestia megaterium]